MSNNNQKDRLYAQPINGLGQFAFDANVARVFPDMISRSVPGYAAVTEMIGVLAGKYAQANSRCYDLGCSLGAVTQILLERIEQPHCHIIGVDNSPAMVERCCELLNRPPHAHTAEIICADVRDIHIERASLVVMNFTLQFIEPDARLDVLRAIYQGLLPGGAFVLSEKIQFQDTEQQQDFSELHVEFKRSHGYSELEISQKRAALENVLIAEPVEQHIQRLRDAGFSRVYLWFQCLNFVSFLAIK